MSLRTLVTGFGPFGKIHENPSSLLAPHFGRPHELLEVSYRAVDEFCKSLCDRPAYDRIICLGVANKSRHIRMEMFGRNVVGRTKDVRGEIWNGEMIEPFGPPALAATLYSPQDYFQQPDLHQHVRLSADAGSYLCNFIFFRLLEMYPGRIGFVHIPSFDEIPPEAQFEAIMKLILMVEHQG